MKLQVLIKELYYVNSFARSNVNYLQILPYYPEECFSFEKDTQPFCFIQILQVFSSFSSFFPTYIHDIKHYTVFALETFMFYCISML